MKRTEEGKLSMLSTRVDGHLLTKLKVIAAERGVSMQQATAEAVAAWIEETPRRRRRSR